MSASFISPELGQSSDRFLVLSDDLKTLQHFFEDLSFRLMNSGGDLNLKNAALPGPLRTWMSFNLGKRGSATDGTAMRVHLLGGVVDEMAELPKDSVAHLCDVFVLLVRPGEEGNDPWLRLLLQKLSWLTGSVPEGKKFLVLPLEAGRDAQPPTLGRVALQTALERIAPGRYYFLSESREILQDGLAWALSF